MAVAASTSEPVGPFDGSEIIAPRRQTVVRTASVAPNVAIVVSLHMEGREIDKELYQLFNLTCQSVRSSATPP